MNVFNPCLRASASGGNSSGKSRREMITMAQYAPLHVCLSVSLSRDNASVCRCQEKWKVGITGHLPRHLQEVGNLHRAASISRAKATWQTVSAGPAWQTKKGKKKVDSTPYIALRSTSLYASWPATNARERTAGKLDAK